MLTEVTGGAGSTVTLAVPVTPSLVAVMITAVVEEALPVTRPVAETVATVGLPLLHVTARPDGVVVAVS